MLLGCSLLITQVKAQAFFYAYGEQNSNMVILRWQMPSELNTDHFVVERATDGVHFAPLHEVLANGSSAEGQEYKDADNSLPGQVGSYRLKVVGKDGNAFYSPVSTVDLTARIAPELKPTVQHLGSTLRLNVYYNHPVTINFFSEGGSMTASFVVNSTSFDINTSSWGKGFYFYRISDARHPLINSGKIMVL